MASLINAEEAQRDYDKMQADIRRVVASVRTMSDPLLWSFLKTLAYKASQHYDMGEVPFDVAAHFVIAHHDKKE